MRFGNIFTSDCVNVAPVTDPRCADPAFALANPGLCPVPTTLILKPGFAIACVLGGIQFTAYEVKNGVETELTEGVIFSSSNVDVAMVGAISGNATGIGAGTATISATYNGITAHADFVVLAGDNCCAEQSVATMLVVDTSKSMSQFFSVNYGSRLNYALEAVSRTIADADCSKDSLGLQTFNAAESNILITPTTDCESVGALATGIAPTQQLTAFYDALYDAVSTLAATEADRKVIILFSDGEDQTGSYNDTNNPIALLEDFRNGGGIVICFGVRASGKGYRLLSQLATGGFFVNSYADTETVALDYLSGLKGYLCSGNCIPEGDEYEYQGSLNYSGFAYWDVVNGAVDLQGNGFFDYLPGNGLYVDLVSGTQPAGTSNLGTLQSKASYTLHAGDAYRLTIELAGNQIIDDTPYTARVRVFYLNSDPDQTPIYLLSQTINVDDYTQDFHSYAFNFTSPGEHAVYISIEQLAIPVDADLRVGLLLGSVKFENLTDNAVLFEDDFDTENATYVPPKCGTGSVYVWIPEVAEYGYMIGTNCYGDGCLTDPPPSQAEDPNPLPDIEAGTNPPPPTTTYTSTKSATAECPDDTTNPNSTNLIPEMTSNTAPSGVITADPDVVVNGATEQAYLANEPAELRAFYAFKGTKEMDYQWGPNVLVGATAPWIMYQFDTAKTVDAYEISIGDHNWPVKHWVLEGSNDGATFTELDEITLEPPWPSFTAKRFEFTNATAYTYYRFRILDGETPVITPTGFFFRISNIALFGSTEDGATGGSVTASATATSTISQADADQKAYDAAYSAAAAQLNCQGVYTSTQQYTAKCAVGTAGADVTRSATATSFNSQEEADQQAYAAAKAAAEAALDCTLNTNDRPVTIPLGEYIVGARTDPYGTVKYVEGETGVVTKAVVSINGLTSTYPDGLVILLRTPTGKIVELMRGCGGDQTHPLDNVDLVFDDDAGTPIPDDTDIAAGTYCPTQHGVGIDAPSPLEAGPYLPNIAAALCEAAVDPNGAWSLWVYNRGTIGDGEFDSWDLTLTTHATEQPYLVYGVGDSCRTEDEALVEGLTALVPAEANAFIYAGDVMGTVGVVDPEEDWQNFWDWGYGGLAAEMLFTPGNHDWFGESASEQAATRSFWDGSYAAVYGGAFPASILVADPVDFLYSAKFGTWKFIVFNACATDEEAGALESGGSVYDFVNSELQEAGYNCVLVGHKPRYSGGASHGDDATFDSLWKLAVDNGALAWISGHEHILELQTARDRDGAVDATGCTQIICGGGSSNLYALNGAYDPSYIEYDGAVNGLLRLILTPTSLSIAFVDTDGNVIDGSGVTIAV